MRKSLLIIVLIVFSAVYWTLLADLPAPAPPPAEEPVPGSSRLAGLLGSDSEQSYPRVVEPRQFRFPEDHGPHPEYRNEWWYVTGNLDAVSGERLGFELTLFRFLLTPAAPAAASAWRSNQVYIGHFAISDVRRDEFYVAERYSRGSMGLAGASSAPFRVWLEDWQIGEESGAAGTADVASWRLQAADDEFAIDLSLTSKKRPVLNGVNGLSQKSAEPGNASYYYSMTRLQSDGTVRIGDRRFEVSGLSWLDREWGSSALSQDQSGWDWFALQLDDDSELMFYSIRKLDGTQDLMSAGTFVAPSGRTQHLRYDDVSIDVLDHWESPLGGRYPSRWRIGVPSLDLSLSIEPVMAAQELQTSVRYWEGAVDVSGLRGGEALRGRGYVELTGYAD